MLCENDCAYCGKIVIILPQYTSRLSTRLVIFSSPLFGKYYSIQHMHGSVLLCYVKGEL